MTFDQRQQQVDTQYNVAGDQIFQGPTYIYEAPPALIPPANLQEQRDLSILLQKVKTFWIEGVLDKSIHTTLLLDLIKEFDQEAVQHPWESVLELPDQSQQRLPPEQKIGHLFDEMNRAMLILGEPGSGKTITLLELAEELLELAEADQRFTQPIPVVFNLSTWVQGQSLLAWLVTELSVKYQVPKQSGRAWLESHRVLPLLDGLDEVSKVHRAGCVAAINEFGEAVGLAGLAVCCRLQEYTELPARLKLNGAIRLQPLTPAQIDQFLARAGAALVPLRQALQHDQQLQTLAQSPLMLNIMSVAYQDSEVFAKTQSISVETQRSHLLDAYIERMFRRRGKSDPPYPKQQIRNWLAWLARGMTRHNQTLFLIEQLQPSWLTSQQWLWAYVLGSRVLVGLLFGFLVGLVFWLFENILRVEIFGPYFWPVVSVVSSLSIGLIDGARFATAGRANTQNGSDHSPHGKRRLFVAEVLGVSLLEWFIFVSTFFLIQGNSWIFPLVFVIGGLSFGGGTGLIWGFRSRGKSWAVNNDVQPTERLVWMGSNGLRGAAIGTGFGAVFGLIWGLVWGLIWGINGGIFPTIGSGLVDLSQVWNLGSVEVSIGQFAIIFGLIGLTFGGVQKRISESKTVPNQGIRLSFRNSLVIGLFCGVAVGSSYWLGTGIVHGFLSLRAILTAASLGFAFGLVALTWFGGFDVILHYILRFILWRTGRLPWNLAHFLDHSADLIFLRKVGCAYIFIHRLLLEHFAELAPEPETQR